MPKSSNNNINFAQNFSNSSNFLTNSTNTQSDLGQNFANSSMNVAFPHRFNNFMCFPNFMENYRVATLMQNLQRVLFIMDTAQPIIPQQMIRSSPLQWNN